MDRGAWGATIHGVAESDVTQWLAHTYGGFYIFSTRLMQWGFDGLFAMNCVIQDQSFQLYGLCFLIIKYRHPWEFGFQYANFQGSTNIPTIACIKPPYKLLGLPNRL